MIPKIIHYCWLSGDEIPEKLQLCMDSWKKFLPEYEFMLWDLNRFDINQILWTKQAFESKKYAFAADYIRLYAIYTYGGIYLDMDVEVLKSFNPLLNRKYILGFEDMTGIEGGIIGSEKGSKWLKECLEYYENRAFVKPDGSYDTLPLPRIMYSRLKNCLSNMEIFGNEYLTAKSYKTGVITITENTYSIHHFEGSWLPAETKYQHALCIRLQFLPACIAGRIAHFVALCKYQGIGAAIVACFSWVRKCIVKTKSH